MEFNRLLSSVISTYGEILFSEEKNTIKEKINEKISKKNYEIIKSENEIEKISSFLRSQGKPDYIDEITIIKDNNETSNESLDNEKDDLYYKAVDIIKAEGKASTSFLQRKLQIGYNRAARMIDQMEENGVVSKANHTGKREVL